MKLISLLQGQSWEKSNGGIIFESTNPYIKTSRGDSRILKKVTHEPLLKLNQVKMYLYELKNTSHSKKHLHGISFCAGESKGSNKVSDGPEKQELQNN